MWSLIGDRIKSWSVLSGRLSRMYGFDCAGSKANVRYWHLADIDAAGERVRFRGQSGHH